MSKLTIVKFTKPWQGYGPNEVAGFPEEKAEQLIDGGLAELHGKGKTKASKPAGGSQNQTTDVKGGGNQPDINDAGDKNETDNDDKKP